MHFPKDAAAIAVTRALDEDAADDDVTTRWSVPPGRTVTAEIIARQPGVAAALPIAAEVYHRLGGVTAHPIVAEGAEVAPGDVLVRLSGEARTLITGERTTVNFLQRLCGIATLTHHYAAAIADLPVRLLDTRKTAPGLRMLDKYAVAVGGGQNHRLNLAAMVLLKENHITAAGGITPAVEAVRRAMAAEARHVDIEVEVEDLAGAKEALEADVEWIMLDNMPPDEIKEVVSLRDRRDASRSTRLEASGTITLATLRAVALTGVDAISVGSLTHSAPALDLSMLIQSAKLVG